MLIATVPPVFALHSNLVVPLVFIYFEWWEARALQSNANETILTKVAKQAVRNCEVHCHQELIRVAPICSDLIFKAKLSLISLSIRSGTYL